MLSDRREDYGTRRVQGLGGKHDIPDFTRYAKNQRSQGVGQVLGLPLTMTVFSFLGIAVTAATANLNGGPFPNPTFIESLYNYGLFLTFVVSGLLYLGLSMIGGRAPEPAREPETT